MWGRSGLGEAHADPHILSKLSLHDTAMLGLGLRNAQAPSLGQGRAALPAHPGYEKAFWRVLGPLV